jgi:hypothetical protein
MKRPLTGIALALMLLSTSARAETWDFDDPEIAAAALGMLSPLLQPGFCGDLHINEERFTATLKLRQFLPEEVRERCDECYLTGLRGATTLLDQKGKSGYCATMIKIFGPNGTMVPGLVE